MEQKKYFYILRGLPGGGKSTKAKELAGGHGQIFSTDDYFCLNAENEYRFDAQQLGPAHAWNQRRSLEAVKASIPIVIIDNTNTTVWEMKAYLPHIKLAQSMGYEILIEEPETAWRFDIDELVKLSTHGVPREAIQRMLNRYAKDVTLDDILA